jgi:hypothetical protein
MFTVIYNPTHGQTLLGDSNKPCMLIYVVESGTEYASVALRPGLTLVEAEPPSHILEHEDVLVLSAEIKTSADLTVVDARFAIQAHHDIDLVQEFCGDDKRAGVAKALSLRVSQLQQEIASVKG